MSEQKTVSATRVITGKVRFSYAKVFKAEADDKGVEKYSTAILIPKSDTETLGKIKAAVKAAAEEGKSSKFGGKIPSPLKTPLRDGDEEKPDDEAYAGMMFLNCSSKTKPGIIDAKKTPITDETDFYSGCYGRVSLNFFAYNTSGSKGIGAGLNNIQKLADGEPLSARTRAEDDFDAVDGEDDFL